jgi:hypothetical protein
MGVILAFEMYLFHKGEIMNSEWQMIIINIFLLYYGTIECYEMVNKLKQLKKR